MRVKKISAFIMAVMLVLSPFTLFSFAADSFILKDSGSPEVSMMAMRSIAANDGISLAAAEGNSGIYGYNIEPSPVSLSYYVFQNFSDRWHVNFPLTLSAGSYSFSYDVSLIPYRLGVWNNTTSSDIPVTYSIDGGSVSGHFTIDSNYSISIYLAYRPSDVQSDFSLIDSSLFILYPVEGISSGYSYSSGVIEASQTTSRVVLDTWDFGSQPAGNYFINIYTYGRNYKVLFDLAVGDDIVNGRKLTYTYSNGVYTALVSHGGGDLTIRANFTYSKDTLNSPDTSISSIINGSGTISSSIVSSGSYIFNITDVVAVPLESAGLEQFGVFGSIVGFLRDEFSSMKSWIATQIDKIAGDPETKSDVNDAQSELQKEVEDLNNLSGQLDTQASNLEQQFTTDFAIPDTVSGQGTNFQSIYTSLFGSLGVFGIFIWLPIVMAVIKKLLRL